MFKTLNILFEIDWYLSTGQAYPDSYRVIFLNSNTILMEPLHAKCTLYHANGFLQESQHCFDLARMPDSLFAWICFEPLGSTLVISFCLMILSFKFEELSSWFVELLPLGQL